MRQANRFAVVPCSLLFTALALCILPAVNLFDPAPASAQEQAPGASEEAGVEKDVEKDAGAEEELTLVETADKSAATETDADKDKEVDKSMLEWMSESLGVFYGSVFLALSFTLVSLLVMNILTARRDALVPEALLDGFESLLNEQKYQEAYDLARGDESMLGQVLSAGLAKLSRGYPEAIEAMQETGEEENMKLEHRLSYIALIGTVSPMIGLMGTVWGMIKAFQTISMQGANAATLKPEQLAGDISIALFTTLVGLIIAILAIAAYNILRNRIARLVLDVGIRSEDLMSRFSSVGNKNSP